MAWEIQFDKSTKCCQQCRHNFDIGEPYFSALFLAANAPQPKSKEPEKSHFERRDFCAKCWDAPEAKTDVFSFWQTRILPKDTPKTPKEILVSFFDNLFSGAVCPKGPIGHTTFRVDGGANVQSELKPKVIYLFALILIRKRILKLIQTAVRDKDRFLVLERATDAKRYDVQEITISDSELVALRDEFGKLFEFNL